MNIPSVHFNKYWKTHHLSADGAVNSSQPGAVPPVGYDAGACVRIQDMAHE